MFAAEPFSCSSLCPNLVKRNVDMTRYSLKIRLNTFPSVSRRGKRVLLLSPECDTCCLSAISDFYKIASSFYHITKVTYRKDGAIKRCQNIWSFRSTPHVMTPFSRIMIHVTLPWTRAQRAVMSASGTVRPS